MKFAVNLHWFLNSLVIKENYENRGGVWTVYRIDNLQNHDIGDRLGDPDCPCHIWLRYFRRVAEILFILELAFLLPGKINFRKSI